MTSVTIYHNPRCGTSRKALELIRARGITPTIVEYLKTPPSVSELERLLKLLKLEPRALLRQKEPLYATLKLDDPSLSHAELVRAMVEHPILIQRPIIVSGSQAVLGRPPEAVESILNSG